MADEYRSSSEQGHEIRVRRACFAQLTIFEVSEDELEQLRVGSPVSVYLNFAVALGSVAVSVAVALVTATFASNRTFLVFLVVDVVAILGGLLLLVLWLVKRKSVTGLVETIRRRLPPEGDSMAPLEESDRRGKAG